MVAEQHRKLCSYNDTEDGHYRRLVITIHKVLIVDFFLAKTTSLQKAFIKKTLDPICLTLGLPFTRIIKPGEPRTRIFFFI